MKALTEQAVLACDHTLGRVDIRATQNLVRIKGQRVLVERDPEGRPINGCPNVSATIKPCLLTLPVKKGYSALVRIEGHRMCLDTVTGLTDGTPPGTVNYTVRNPGQTLVDVEES
jgi:hypothetical protein